MKKNIIVVDDFYTNPDAVREFALKLQYSLYYDKDSGSSEDQTYVRSSKVWFTTPIAQLMQSYFKSEEMVGALESLIGSKIDREHWQLPVHWNGAFHVKNHRDGIGPDHARYHPDIGSGIHHHVGGVHAVGSSGWSGVLYLSPNPPLSGGIATWRAKEEFPADRWFMDFDLNRWERMDRIGNVYNRLVLLRGNICHTSSVGWGDSFESGRLFQTFFMRVLDDQPAEHCDRRKLVFQPAGSAQRGIPAGVASPPSLT